MRKLLALVVLTALFSFFAPSARAMIEQVCIRVKLNSNILPSPRTVTLLSIKLAHPLVLPAQDGCFQFPERLRHAKSIDVLLQAGTEAVHLRGLVPGAFTMPWDILLSDRASDIEFQALRNVPVDEKCTVVYKPARGLGETLTQSGCRSHLASPDSTNPK